MSKQLVKATIRWFNSLSGEGVVRLETGECVFLHFTAIDEVSKNNHHWPADKDRDFLSKIARRECLVNVWQDPTGKQIEFLTFKTSEASDE